MRNKANAIKPTQLNSTNTVSILENDLSNVSKARNDTNLDSCGIFVYIQFIDTDETPFITLNVIPNCPAAALPIVANKTGLKNWNTKELLNHPTATFH